MHALVEALLDWVLGSSLDDVYRLRGSNPLKLNTRLPLQQRNHVLLLKLVEQDTDTGTTSSVCSTTAMDVRLNILLREHDVMQENGPLDTKRKN